MGHGFCNRLEGKLTFGFFLANCKPLKTLLRRSFAEVVVWVLNGAFVSQEKKKKRPDGVRQQSGGSFVGSGGRELRRDGIKEFSVGAQFKMTFWGSEQTEGKCVITDTHTQHTHALWHPPHSAAPSLACLLFVLPTLSLFIPALPLFLWVTLTRVWGWRKTADERSRKRRRRRTYQRGNQWVCPPHQTAAFDTVSHCATALLGDFSGYFHRL